MRFKITNHSGHPAPDDALDLLWQRLGSGGEQVTFERVGVEIEANVGEDAPVSMTQDEREQVGRSAVLRMVLDACDGAPDLKSDWFAVSGGV